jgi:DNA-binding response OmpR family regulator
MQNKNCIPPALPQQAAEDRASDSMNVILVEDDELVRAALASGLCDFGFHVRDFSDPRDLLGKPDAIGPPDVLITDVDLGSTLNGFDVAAAAHGFWPSVRIILISGLPAEHTGQRLDPRDRYLQKPFTYRRLLRTIGELVHVAPF